MEMNNDIFTPNLPIPEPVSFESKFRISVSKIQTRV